jgi:hypothetical protein
MGRAEWLTPEVFSDSQTSDGIELEFDIDLMLGPGSLEERLVCRVQSRVSLLARW